MTFRSKLFVVRVQRYQILLVSNMRRSCLLIAFRLYILFTMAMVAYKNTPEVLPKLGDSAEAEALQANRSKRRRRGRIGRNGLGKDVTRELSLDLNHIQITWITFRI